MEVKWDVVWLGCVFNGMEYVQDGDVVCCL